MGVDSYKSGKKNKKTNATAVTNYHLLVVAALKEILRWIVFPSRISALNENTLYHFSTT